MASVGVWPLPIPPYAPSTSPGGPRVAALGTMTAIDVDTWRCLDSGRGGGQDVRIVPYPLPDSPTTYRRRTGGGVKRVA